MPLYFYTARNPDQKLIRGTIDAIDATAAREALAQMSLHPEELHEATLEERRAVERGEYDDVFTGIEPDITQPAPLSLGAETLPSSPAEQTPNTPEPEVVSDKVYYPFSDTLRLYAGWLLAWYILVYALGGYQYTRELPWRVPYVEALLPPFSPIVLTFTLASFLFLLGGSIHRSLGGGRLKGLLVTVATVGVFIVYNLNI